MRNGTMATALAVLALGVMLALSGCGTTAETTGPAPDTVTAIGTGSGNAAPDTAEVALGVTFTAKDRIAAQNGASRVSAAIIAAVKAAGASDKEIQTSQISLSQQFDPTGRTVTGYQASQSIDVKTKAIDRIGAIVAAATTAGATDVSGPTFSLSDANAARIDAIDKAMADAKARAAAIAKAAGRGLGRVISVTASETNPVGPMFGATAAPSAGKAVVPPVEPGQVETSVQLTVVFALQ